MKKELSINQMMNILKIHADYLCDIMRICNYLKRDWEKEQTFIVTLRAAKECKAYLDNHNVDTSAFDGLDLFPLVEIETAYLKKKHASARGFVSAQQHVKA